MTFTPLWFACSAINENLSPWNSPLCRHLVINSSFPNVSQKSLGEVVHWFSCMSDSVWRVVHKIGTSKKKKIWFKLWYNTSIKKKQTRFYSLHFCFLYLSEFNISSYILELNCKCQYFKTHRHNTCILFIIFYVIKSHLRHEVINIFEKTRSFSIT